LLEGLDSRTGLIYQPIKEDLLRVEERLRTLSGVETSYVAELLDYVCQSGGKRVRPAITLLAASFHSHDHNLPIIMATAVELLHIATLIHDDTVDNSPLRRGKATVSGVWGKNVAVLLGDYVFATSATFVCDTQNVRVIRRFSETIMELSSGELLEHFNTNNWSQSREDYKDRIYRKTASLFRTAGETGAILSDVPEETVQALKSYGYSIGMAFQIVDDILDVEGDTEEIGKPVGNDLLQGVLTLPGIMLIERYPKENPIQELFQQSDRASGDSLKRALDMIQNSGIIQDCYAVARGYCLKAREAVEPLPDNPARRSILQLSDYVMERTR
jgi:geranylgeranyl pyrophosphate synthase